MHLISVKNNIYYFSRYQPRLMKNNLDIYYYLNYKSSIK